MHWTAFDVLVEPKVEHIFYFFHTQQKVKAPQRSYQRRFSCYSICNLASDRPRFHVNVTHKSFSSCAFFSVFYDVFDFRYYFNGYPHEMVALAPDSTKTQLSSSSRFVEISIFFLFIILFLWNLMESWIWNGMRLIFTSKCNWKWKWNFQVTCLSCH